MTSSMSVELTPGQRCLLDLLQRKLLNTIQSYAKLSLERQESSSQACNFNELEAELHRLKEKIRRISARQKRFTLEIINGNGNNTIPKESFFEALGLVTKEALNKLNSKTNERRRRTTANPRFSHEAIQAKRALEPLQKRLDPRVSNNKREASKRTAAQQRQQQQQQPNNNSDANNIEATNNSASTAKNNNISNNNNNNSGKASNQQALNSTRSSSRSSSNRNRNLMIHNERRELLAQFEKLQRQIDTKVSRIKDKRKSNKKLERQNELIRKRGLDIISAINMINPNLTFQEDNQQQQQLSNASDNNSNSNNNHSQSDQTTQPTEPLDIWIDMKCDESLDGLD